MMNRNRCIYGVLLILWFIVSILTSAMPSDSLLIDNILGYDKLLHAIKFIIFTVILYNFLHYSDWSYTKKLLLYIPLQFYPFLDELIQINIPSRSFSAYDILANYVGVLIGIVVSLSIRVFIYKKRVLL